MIFIYSAKKFHGIVEPDLISFSNVVESCHGEMVVVHHYGNAVHVNRAVHFSS